jgi:phosphomannomutase
LRTLKISISGVRGVIGDSLTPPLLIRFAQSFGTYTSSGTIVVGRDSRSSGEMVQEAVLAGLLSSGCRVISLGICPTPTILMAVRNLKAAGGIAITASHNPSEWNALKFLDNDGCYLSGYEAEELLSIYHQGEYVKVPGEAMHPVRHYEHAMEDHIRAILDRMGSLPSSRKRPKVVLDCCNGAGSVMGPELLRRLGCEVAVLHAEQDRPFPHPPEPIPENLSELRARVRSERADVGFALDPDADRLAVIDDKGNALGEENTLVLAADYILGRRRGPVVANLSTTAALDDVAARHKTRCYRSKVGEVNVTDLMRKVGAVIGGEGNGGVIFPEINIARDAMVGMAIVLHSMSASRKRLHLLAAALPQYVMLKESLESDMGNALLIVERLKKNLPAQRLDLTEGVKAWFPDGWVHIRPSNTEPVIRINVESRTRRDSMRLMRRVRKLLR